MVKKHRNDGFRFNSASETFCGRTPLPYISWENLDRLCGSVIDTTVCVVCCEALWTVVSGWLTPEQRNKTLLVNRDELDKYIAADQLEPHMLSAPAQ